jgi:hypothetical protein
MVRIAIAVLVVVITGCAEHGASNGTCQGLSLGDCRVTAGCKPDLCDGCICDVSYRGCLATAETPTACPALGCPSGLCCSSEAECTDQTSCVPPGTPQQGCGACDTTPGDCTGDAECKPRGATLICAPIPCSCTAQSRCVEGCSSDSACTEGQQCDLASARCVAQTCTTVAQCPANFDCTSSACVRASCTDDRDCDGFCVLGSCFAGGRGVCTPPAA